MVLVIESDLIAKYCVITTNKFLRNYYAYLINNGEIHWTIQYIKVTVDINNLINKFTHNMEYNYENIKTRVITGLSPPIFLEIFIENIVIYFEYYKYHKYVS